MTHARRYVLIGERWNQAVIPRWSQMALDDPAGWLEISVRCGAFADARSTRRLRQLGVELSRSVSNRGGSPDGIRAMNLMPPAPQGEPWGEHGARRVARQFMAEAAGAYTAVFLCGRRVARAFGLPDRLPLMSRAVLAFMPDGTPDYAVLEACECVPNELVILPHPSGLSRWWNDETNVIVAREEVLGRYQLPDVRVQDEG